MKKKYIGLISGIILSGIIGSIIELYVGTHSCTDCGLHFWNDQQDALIFLVPLLIVTGLITNYITKTEGFFQKVKEGSIVGFAGGMISFLVMLIFIDLPVHQTEEGSQLLGFSYDFPMIVLLPLFLGFVILGELFFYRKKDYIQPKTKLFFSIIIVLILTIIPIWTNISLASEEDEITGQWSECYWEYPPIVFSEDNINKTLTVTQISDNDYNWNEFRANNGTLPNGVVKKGDIITNCSESGHIIWLTCNQAVYQWDFR